MSSVSSAHPGRWKTSVVEYTRDIMNAISDPNIQIIVIRKPAQVSGTEMILNAIMYFIVQDPSSIIWTLPTLGMAEDYSKARLSAMIRDSWIFKEYLGADYYKQKKSNDTILHKLFPGARLLMTGSNSEIGVSGNPMRCFFGDEIDKYFITKGGDTIELGIKRTQTYEENRKIILTSTPSITGMSKIDEWYDKGDHRVYKVPCIKCGFKQVLKFKNIKGFRIEKGVYDAKKSFYECPKCKSKLSDHDLNRMVKKGSSVATKKFNGIASFDLGCEIISPWVKMRDIVEGFINCKANPELYREWVNLSQGESYNDTNIELKAGTLQKRAEKYDFTIPLDAGVLIGAADVHDDRIECVAMAFGVMEEQWIMEHHIFYGD
ncbi:phage terminase large subunit family protein, partial [bacterium]|nr:phage terminase large subunit family protein [bacterium]